MAKINLELGGKYTAGQVFKQAQEDAKKFGKETKDVSDIGKKSFGEIAKYVDGPLKQSMNGFSQVLQGFASGGIWGVVASVAVAAIGAIAEKWKEAKEKTKAFVEYINTSFVEGMKTINEGFAEAGRSIDETARKVKAIQDLLTGQISTDASTKVHELHIQTLQKITDDMSEAGKKVVYADEELQKAKIKMAELQEKQTAQMDAAEQAIVNASKRVVDARDALSDMMHQEQLFQADNLRALTEYDFAKAKVTALEQRYADGLISTEQYQEKMKDAIANLTKVETEHKDVVEKLKTVKEEVAKAEENVKKANEDVIKAEQAKVALTLQHTQQLNAMNTSIADAEFKQREATRALEEEKKETQKAANAEREKKESAEAAAEWELENLTNQQELQDLCDKAKIDAKDVLDEYKNKLEESGEIEAALEAAKERLRKAIEEAAKQQEDANGGGEGSGKGGGKGDGKGGGKGDGKGGGKGDGKGGGQHMTVALDNSSTGDIGQQVEDNMSFKDWQKKNREDARKARDAKNNMKIDQAKMTKALKGEMPEAEAKEWIKYAKSKYTPEQMKELANLGVKSQLLTPKSKEWKQQQDRFKNMLKAMEGEDKNSKKRDKNLEDIAKSSKEQTKQLKELGAK